MMARSYCDPVVAQQRSHVVRMHTLHIKGNALLDTGSSDALWLLEKKNDVVAIPPNSGVLFSEIKTPKGRLSKLQEYRLKELEEHFSSTATSVS